MSRISYYRYEPEAQIKSQFADKSDVWLTKYVDSLWANIVIGPAGNIIRGDIGAKWFLKQVAKPVGVVDKVLTISSNGTSLTVDGTAYALDQLSKGLVQDIVRTALNKMAATVLSGTSGAAVATAIAGSNPFIAAGLSLAVTIGFDISGLSSSTEDVVRQLFGTQPVTIDVVRKDGTQLGGAVHNSGLRASDEMSGVLDVLGWVKSNAGGVQVGDISTVLRKPTIASGATSVDYVVKPGNLAEYAADSMRITQEQFFRRDALKVDGTSVTVEKVFAKFDDKTVAAADSQVSVMLADEAYGSRDELAKLREIAFGPEDITRDSRIFFGSNKGERLEPAQLNLSGTGYFFGAGGDDIISGSDGSDKIFGDYTVERVSGEGIDYIDARDGHDYVFGGGDADTMFGRGGNDTLVGGLGQDNIDGGSDNDKIFAQGEQTREETDKNTLKGGAGQDTIVGAGGDDILIGSDDGDADRLIGDKGNDRYEVGAGDTLVDSSGSETVWDKNGNQLTGGTKEKKGDHCATNNSGDNEDVYKDDAGNEYRKSGNGLSIKLAAGGTVTIDGWSDKHNFGIKLKDDDTSGGGASCDPPQKKASPLVLDLDGDGIETTGLQQAPSFFDIDTDGMAERTGWVSADDGLLAIDTNSNGTIDNAGELFGYGTTISLTAFGDPLPFAQPGGIGVSYTSGFEKLALLDETRDGKIDSSDTVYGQLRVWRDLNQDGTSQAAELFSLADVGVVSIGVVGQSAVSNNNGNTITDTATFRYSDGSDRQVADVWFAFDQLVAEYQRPELDAETAALPYLSGSGNVKDLQSAAAEDPGLKSMLQALEALDAADAGQLFVLTDQILQRWHGAELADAGGRGVNSDGRHVAVFEAATDTPFRQWSGSNPRPQGGAQVEAEYQLFLRNVTAKLFAQTSLGQTLLPEVTFENDFFLTVSPAADSATILERLEAAAPTGQLQKIAYWHAMVRVLDAVYNSFADVKAAGSPAGYFAAVGNVLAGQGLSLSYDSILRAAVGGDGADVLRTKSLVSELEDPGDYGRTNAVLEWVTVGGVGNDDIRLGGGKQIVYFAKGQGSDVVTGNPFEFDGWNFAPRVEVRMLGLTQSEVSIKRSSDYLSKDIVITILETGETLTLRDAVNEAAVQTALVFGDTAPVSLASIAASAIMASTSGDDRIEDVVGVNALDGGIGNDMLIGRDGDDDYTFAIGHGTDTIVEEDSEGLDSIVFGNGITFDDLVFERVGSRGQDLRLRVGVGNDTVIVTDQFTKAAPRIEQLVFANGDTLDSDSLRFMAQNGAGGDAVVLGFDFSADDLSASRSGQVLTGLDKGDTYRFFAGTGDVTIADRGIDGADKDSVEIGAAFTDVSVARPDVDVFVFTLASGEKLTVDNRAGLIETFSFDDKTYTSEAMIAAIIQRELEGDPTKVTGSSGAETLNGTALADVINGIGGNDVINAGDGDDVVNAGFGNDTIDGGAGNDIVEASYGINDIRGGTGDDVIETSDYNNIYRFDRGDGRDIILGNEGFSGALSRIVFGSGITASDLTFSFEKIDATQYSDLYYYDSEQYGLRVDIAGGTDSLLLVGNNSYDVGGFNRFEFSDGSSLARSVILNTLRTPTGADQLIAGAGRSSAADLLRGGAGNDTIVGGGGNDVFAVAPGDGQDTVLGAGFGTGASVNLGGNINAMSDIAFERTGANYQDLVIRLVATGDTLTIKDQFADYATAEYDDATGNYVGRYQTSTYVTTVRLADGTPIPIATIMAAFNAPTSGSDLMVGSAADDVFDGGAGNDTLVGGLGSELYLFGRGSGADSVVETAKSVAYPFAGDFVEPVAGLRDNDRIVFKNGVAISDLDIVVTGTGLQDLKITIRDTGESIEIANQVMYQSSYGTLSAEEWSAQYAFSLGSDPLFASGVESFALADGTAFTREQFLAFVTSRDDSGANAITTGDGGGMLDGGLGNDSLNGGAGRDTYVLAIGTGDDTATDRGGSDTLRFAAGVLPEWVEFTRVGTDGADLLVEIDGDARSAMTIKGQFDGQGSRIEKFVFPDGTTWTWQQVQEHLLQASISEQADTVLGTRGADVIRTRSGDDVVRNLGGGDLIDGGDGWDTVELEGAAARYQVAALADRVEITDIDDGGRVLTLVDVEAVRFRGGAGVPAETIAFTGNAAPVAGTVTIAGREDTVLRISPAMLLAGATDPDGNALRIVGVSAPVGGSVSIDAIGTILFTPAHDVQGEARFTYTVSDAGGLTASAQAIVTIAVANDAPVAADDVGLSLVEGSTLRIAAAALTGNDTDADGDTITIADVFDAVGGTVSIDVDGSILFQPQPNSGSQVGFTYRIADGRGGTSEASVAISVQNINDAPALVSNAPLTLRSGNPGYGFVLAADADGDTLTYALAQDGAPVNGTVAMDPSGAYVYQANDGFVGSDQFSISVDDGHGGTVVATVAVTVVAPNFAPLVDAPVADQSAAPGSSWTFALDPAMFSDPNGDALELFAFDASGLVLPQWLQYDAATWTFSGTVPGDAIGFVDIAIAASDSELEAVDVFRLNFGTTNNAPTLAAPIPDQSSTEDAAWSFAIPAGTFADADGDTLTLSATLAGGAALPVWLSFNAATMMFTGTPPANANGVINLSVTASDGQASVSAPLVLTVTAVNDLPDVAATRTIATQEDTATAAIAIGAVDVDGDTLTYSVKSGFAPVTGNVAFDAANGTFVYTPAANASGADSFTIVVSDSQGGTAEQVVSVTIAAVNDLPDVAATRSIATQEDTASAPIAIGAVDVDGDTLTYSVKSGFAPAKGTVAFDAASGTFVYTPAANASGADSFTIVVSDGQGGTAEQVVSVTIAPVNDVAVIAGMSTGTVVEDTALTATGTLTVSDPDVAEAAFQTATGVAGLYGTLSITAAGAWTYTLNNAHAAVQGLNTGQTLSDAIVVRSVDGTMQTVTVAIQGLNEAGGGTIFGTPGNDSLNGTAGDDRIDAKGSADIVQAGSGNDVIVANVYDGFDVYNGGLGGDTYDASALTASVAIDLGVLISGAYVGEAVGLQNGIDVLIDFENAIGGGGGDLITGNALANRLQGGAGSDTLLGLAGNDRLEGGSGNDTLFGGAGADTLAGGSGADYYVFNTALGAGNVDVISDFSVVNDSIRLEDSIMTALGANGTLAASAFTIGAAASSAAHRVVYNSATGGLFYDADGSGAGAQVQIATLSAGLAMTNADVLII